MPEGTPERLRPLWELAGRNVIDEEAIREFRAIDLADAMQQDEVWKEVHAEWDAVKLIVAIPGERRV